MSERATNSKLSCEEDLRKDRDERAAAAVGKANDANANAVIRAQDARVA